MRDAILVLGMHRSGTSAMTGAIVRLGAAAPRGFMGGDAGNERGYFESVPFMHFHDGLLSFAGSHWHDWRRFDPQRLAVIPADSRAEARRLLDEEFGEAPLFALKDPRVCRFIPFWLSVLREAKIAPHAVIPFRSPFEVAESLRARNGFPIENGLLLWLRHVLDAERETRGLPRGFADMDDLLADWRACLTRIGRDIGVAWPKLDDEAAAGIESFLSRDLKHHNLEIAEQDVAPAWIARAYEALLILARNPNSQMAGAALDEVADSFEQACALLGPLVGELEAQNAQLRKDVAALTAERDALAKARAEAPPLRGRQNGAGEPAVSALDQLQALRPQTAEVRKSLERLRDALQSRNVDSGDVMTETNSRAGIGQ